MPPFDDPPGVFYANEGSAIYQVSGTDLSPGQSVTIFAWLEWEAWESTNVFVTLAPNSSWTFANTLDLSTCSAGVQTPQHHVSPPANNAQPEQIAQPADQPLAATGSGLIGDQLAWGLGLVLGGCAILFAVRRRRT